MTRAETDELEKYKAFILARREIEKLKAQQIIELKIHNDAVKTRILEAKILVEAKLLKQKTPKDTKITKTFTSANETEDLGDLRGRLYVVIETAKAIEQIPYSGQSKVVKKTFDQYLTKLATPDHIKVLWSTVGTGAKGHQSWAR